jgi:hypothetical protein
MTPQWQPARSIVFDLCECANWDYSDQFFHIDTSAERSDDPLDWPVFPQEGDARLGHAE